MSNIYATSLASLEITLVCSVSCCSLLVVTSGGVVGVSFSFISSISYLYPSIVCTMIYICSSALLSAAYTLSGIFLKTSYNLFSNLSACFFSSLFSILNCSIFICSIYLTSLAISSSVASALARDCTSCVTLTCNLYSDFVGIFAKTNSNCSNSLSGFCAISSSALFPTSFRANFSVYCTLLLPFFFHSTNFLLFLYFFSFYTFYDFLYFFFPNFYYSTLYTRISHYAATSEN
jgi:hypothetical protein